MQSMTGCGKGIAAADGLEVTVELKSVNHRFLDIACRLPRNIGFLDEPLRKQLSASLKRGHVEAFISLKADSQSTADIQLNPETAARYIAASKQLFDLGARGDLSVYELMQLEGVLVSQEHELDEDAVLALFLESCSEAIRQLTEMRGREGENLKADLSAHLDAIAGIREAIAQRAPCVVQDYRTRLQKRLDQILENPVDPIRLAQEVAIMADRCAIDEELSRLESHLRQFRTYLNAPDEVGKKLDFLTQEMNREANTIGSKANDAQIAQLVVELKSEIEKLREQVQNVE